MRFRSYFIFHFFLVICTHSLFGQFSDEYNKYKRLFPDESKICINSNTDFIISLVNGNLKIEENFSEENIYLSSGASHFSEDEITYSSFFELMDIKAASYSFEKGKYNEVEVKKFTHKDHLSNSVFYDDNRKVKFFYPKLGEGSKTMLSYKYLIKNPYILSKTFFTFSYPTINSTFTITVDKGIEVAFKTFNTDSIKISYSEEIKNGKKIYKWVCKNVQGIKKETNSVGYNYYLPHIIPRIVSYANKNKEVVVLKTIDDLYQWYYNLIKGVNKQENDSELVHLVNELIQGKSSEVEKVKALYYWVQQNIKYVAFEYELGGFVPREANEIYRQKYGDCKDNTSLLKKMLEIAGINSYFTWIGTRELPYRYNDVPSPASDNHMILTYFIDSVPYFLDATGRFNPLEIPSSFIQGKEALISIDSSNYLIKQVPIIKAKDNILLDSIFLKINNNNLEGAGTVVMDNYPKMEYFNALESVTSNSDLLTFYNNNLEKGSNKFLISSFDEKNKYSYDKEFIISYSFLVENYIISSTNGDELYLNLNLNKHVLGLISEEKDMLTKEFDYKNYRRYKYSLLIPEGYQVEHLPESFHIDNEFFNTELTYKIEDNKIVYEHILIVDFLFLTKENQLKLNSALNKIKTNYNETIVLKKTK